MTRYLLDTNIISNTIKPLPSEALLKWLGEQTDDSLFISSLSLAEIWRGIVEKPTGKKRRELEAWFSGAEGPQAIFRGRVLPFDENAALIWGDLMAAGSAAGRANADRVQRHRRARRGRRQLGRPNNRDGRKRADPSGRGIAPCRP